MIAEQLEREAVAAKERLVDLYGRHRGTSEYALVADRIERRTGAKAPDEIATATNLAAPRTAHSAKGTGTNSAC